MRVAMAVVSLAVSPALGEGALTGDGVSVTLRASNVLERRSAESNSSGSAMQCPPGSVGDVCHIFCPCSKGNHCEFPFFRCRGPPQVGESCMTVPCARGLICDFPFSVCRARRQVGESCVIDKVPCAHGLSCHIPRMYEPGRSYVCYNEPRREGQPCDVDGAYIKCGTGLKCVTKFPPYGDGYCRV